MMDFTEDDVVLDVGAGLGLDGLTIAEDYHPRCIYLLEPGDDEEEFVNKFSYLEIKVGDRPDVKLVLNAAVDTPQKRGVTHLKPIRGIAEAVPLPSKSVSKLMMIHSPYEFDDWEQALTEASRVLRRDGVGAVVVNGDGDKLGFKDQMLEMGLALNNTPPTTRSSRLYFEEALYTLSSTFPFTHPFLYQDIMIVNNQRLHPYSWAYDTYKEQFGKPAVNTERWKRTKHAVVEKAIEMEMVENDGIYRDTIEIGVIFFAHSLAPLEHQLGKHLLRSYL